MADQQRQSQWPLQLAAVAVVGAVALVFALPTLVRPPLSDSNARNAGDAGATDKQASNGTPTSLLTPDAGPLEQSALSWAAPLLHPGGTTTGFENITPNVRALRLDALVTYQVGRLESGLAALKQVESAAEPVQKRVELLARMGAFVDGVRAGPAASLWDTIRTAPLIDYSRSRIDDDRRAFQDAIDRLKAVQATGYIKLDDSRVDARKETDASAQTELWAAKQTAALHSQQRDLDRVEFTVWTRADAVPPAVALALNSETPVRQVIPNLDVHEHLEMIQTTHARLDNVREQSMQFLRSFAKIDSQVRTFLAEPEYKDDPVKAQWARLASISGSFLSDFHAHELAVEASERAIHEDSRYTPSLVLAPVVEANEWVKQAGGQVQERQYAVDSVVSSIISAPVYKVGDAWAYMDQRAGQRPSAADKKIIGDIEARRIMFSRHGYAFSFFRPASRYNWAEADLLEPYVSYDFWWSWATNEEWYHGSDLRLNPTMFPKNAPATRKLWREFCSIVDAESRLNARCVKAVLKDSSAELLPANSDDSKVPASMVRKYWASFFLPDDVARSVGYRRPPIPDGETVRLIDAVPDMADDPAKLLIPWVPTPYTPPRTWQPGEASGKMP